MASTGQPPPVAPSPSSQRLADDRGVSCTTIGVVVGLVSLAAAFIVVIIASVAVPVIARRKEGTRLSECAAKQGRVWQALSMYMNDHAGCLPGADSWVDDITQYGAAVGGHGSYGGPYGYMTPSMDDLMTCPAMSQAPQPRTYAFNRQLGGASPAKIAQPAGTVAIFESNAFTLNPSDDGASLAVPGRHASGKRRGNNYGFADGHVTWEADGTPLAFQPRAQSAGPAGTTP